MFILILKCLSISATCKAIYFHHHLHLGWHLIFPHHWGLQDDSCFFLQHVLRQDYCNCLMPAKMFQNWFAGQIVQNSTCPGLIFAKSHQNLSGLHWLPVRHRINFKSATSHLQLCKVLQIQKPSGVASPCCHRQMPTGSLRKSSLSICVVRMKNFQLQSTIHFHLNCRPYFALTFSIYILHP